MQIEQFIVETLGIMVFGIYMPVEVRMNDAQNIVGQRI